MAAHPVRHARGLGERHGELVGTRLGDDVARLQLILLAREAQREAALIEEYAGRLHVFRLQELDDGIAVARLHGGAVAHQLQRALLAEYVGQCEQDGERDHDRDQHHLPAGIGNHALLTVPLGSSCPT